MEEGGGLHVSCAGHVLLHFRELLDVVDRSVKSTVDRLEASDGVLSAQASYIAERVFFIIGYALVASSSLGGGGVSRPRPREHGAGGRVGRCMHCSRLLCGCYIKSLLARGKQLPSGN